MKTITLSVLAGMLLGSGLLFSPVAFSRSQENSALREDVPSELVSLTDEIVSKILQTDRSRVLVFDFKGPEGASSLFGGWLADQLSLTIARSDKTIAIVDRAKLEEALDERHISRPETFDDKIREDLAASLGAGTVVMGSFVAADNGIGVTAQVRSVSKIEIAVPYNELVQVKIPLTGTVASNLGAPLASLRPKDGIFTPGIGGVSIPRCIYCPPAEFPFPMPQGDKPFKGTVELMTLVTVDGHVKNVVVVRGLGARFDAAAVEAVSRWKVKPAVDIDGTPVPVHEKIEVTFAVEN